MGSARVQRPGERILDRTGLDLLIEVLRGHGYRVVGPTVRDSAIVLGELDRARSADGVGRGNRPRHVPAAPPRRRRGVRALVGPAVVETIPAPAAAATVVHRTGRLVGGTRRRRDTVCVPRSARLRLGGDRGPASCPVSGPGRGHSHRAPVPEPVRRRSAVHRTRRGVLLRLHGDRPRSRSRLRSGAHRTPRRPRPPFLGRRRLRSRHRDPRRRRMPRCRTRRRRRRTHRGRHRHRAYGPAHAGDGPAWTVAAGAGCRRLGGRRRPVPHLRQLHHGVPHLLLHHHRGHDRPDRRARRAVAALVFLFRTRLQPPARRRCADLGGEPLPTVDVPQTRHLVRPVRQLRLRGMRTVHRLVSRRHRHHRGGGAAGATPPVWGQDDQ